MTVQHFFAERGYYCVCGPGHYLSKQPELPCQAVILTVSLPDWPRASTWITTRTKVGTASGVTASFFFLFVFCQLLQKQWEGLFGPKNTAFSTAVRTGFWHRIVSTLPRGKKNQTRSCVNGAVSRCCFWICTHKKPVYFQALTFLNCLCSCYWCLSFLTPSYRLSTVKLQEAFHLALRCSDTS